LSAPNEEFRTGLQYLAEVTLMLQRIRAADPTAGLYEAADFQWWWAQRSRPTDELPQLFWFDDLGRPVAAVVITDSAGQVQLDPIFLPDVNPEWVRQVMERGLAHASEAGFETASLEVDSADQILHEVIAVLGFAIQEDALVETWLSADNRPEISPLVDEYWLANRVEVTERPHHMIKRNGPDVEMRLRQTSLYRPELDLVVYDEKDSVAAYGLFWFDAATATGLVEPMRTDDDHQRRGLARHVLTAGIDLLAKVGARRIKICFEPNNPASSHLYLSVGFTPHRQTVRFVGPTTRS
jgi:GNAT superfamily N-acetyltransferase